MERRHVGSDAPETLSQRLRRGKQLESDGREATRTIEAWGCQRWFPWCSGPGPHSQIQQQYGGCRLEGRA